MIRYCKHCQKDTRYDLYNNTSTKTKVFLGLATLGMIPLFELGSNSDFWSKFAQCQICDEKVEIK